ncbi:SRPBCC family protein [uncultured Serinicoccus sp.]|uniref:SRPBCC family protein n=1 Tax=uncultured Serinicoccus sp. TaxID=735514 RepID=UPI00262F43F0|nr:SRPBCC family protein [uncultured Serinicoccus sp.]
MLARAVLTVLGAAGLHLVIRPRVLTWGATADEVSRALPGDDLLPRPDLVATRAISIDAPVEAVWPWLAQMGQARGGLYSYDWLENLVGCRMASATRVVEEWQHPEVGDDFRLHPDVALRLAVIDPPRAMVVRGAVSATGEATRDTSSMPYDFTWSFTLHPRSPDGSRLVVRERYRYLSRWARPLVETVSVASFVMTERMLRGIRNRAEVNGRPV